MCATATRLTHESCLPKGLEQWSYRRTYGTKNKHIASVLAAVMFYMSHYTPQTAAALSCIVQGQHA
jgi:uncharacterized membrane protein YbaN (DUF454 family)